MSWQVAAAKASWLAHAESSMAAQLAAAKDAAAQELHRVQAAAQRAVEGADMAAQAKAAEAVADEHARLAAWQHTLTKHEVRCSPTQHVPGHVFSYCSVGTRLLRILQAELQAERLLLESQRAALEEQRCDDTSCHAADFASLADAQVKGAGSASKDRGTAP